MGTTERPPRSLVTAAAGGDERAFAELTEPHRRQVHLHCYRMLGSLHDADDAVQETLLRAWRAVGRYEPRASFGAWLHTIATNVCLSLLARRERQPGPLGPSRRERAWTGELLHLQPYPDRLLDELDPGATPDRSYELRESVELAFVTATQLLPPKQRAVLILREVLGWSAREVADALDDTVAAVNSALQRARSGLEAARAAGAPAHRPANPADRAVIARFMEAWDAVDIDGLASLLTRDALLTMPPFPTVIQGAASIREFLATVPAGGHLDEFRLVETAANRQPAVAAYLRDPADGVHRAYGVMVLSVDNGSVAAILGFANAALFPEFGLQLELEA